MTSVDPIPDLPAAIAYLFTAYRTPLSDAVGLVYEHQLARLPFPLLRVAVVEAPHRLPKPFVPSISELRTVCEALRRERLQATPFVPCEECRDASAGWRRLVDAQGVTRLTRCPCWTAHLKALARDGITLRSLITDVRPVEAIEWDAVPEPIDLAALPAPVRQVLSEVKAVAHAHEMPRVSALRLAQTDPDGRPLPEQPLRRR